MNISGLKQARRLILGMYLVFDILEDILIKKKVGMFIVCLPISNFNAN